MDLATAQPCALAAGCHPRRGPIRRLFAALLALTLAAALAPPATPGAAAPAAAKPTAKPGKRGHRRCAAKRARKPRVRGRRCVKPPSTGPTATSPSALPSAQARRPAAPTGPTSAADCPDTELVPDAASAPAAAAAAVCLINVIRHEHGLAMLADNAALRQAARGHADDMVASRYFSHDSPDGRDFADRIFAAGYVSRDDPAALGENIAWGDGARATAASVVAAWMNSPDHRANILDGAFREAGLWVTAGSPLGPDGATYTHDFGARG